MPFKRLDDAKVIAPLRHSGLLWWGWVNDPPEPLRGVTQHWGAKEVQMRLNDGIRYYLLVED